MTGQSITLSSWIDYAGPCVFYKNCNFNCHTGICGSVQFLSVVVSEPDPIILFNFQLLLFLNLIHILLFYSQLFFHFQLFFSIVVFENVLVLESLHALVLEVTHYRVMHALNKTDP